MIFGVATNRSHAAVEKLPDFNSRGFVGQLCLSFSGRLREF